MDLNVPRSGIEGAIWPAIPTGEAALLLTLLQQFEATQWWTAEALRVRQFVQLGQLLAHAAAHAPFYGERLAAAGFQPGAPLTETIWDRIPILTRREVQTAGTALTAAIVPPDHGRLAEVTTTGSTGMPVKVKKTELADQFWRAFTLRDHLWHRRDVAGRLAVIMRDPKGRAPYPQGIAFADWGAATALVYPTGPAHMLDIMTALEHQAEWLQRIAPDHLLTFPTNLLFLARHFIDHGLRLPRLVGISTMGEAVSADTRAACRAAFGLPIHDMYSAEETGYLALQCPTGDHYHAQAEGALVEILDELGRPMAPGAVGRVVVTPLHNFATPLIRYALGDHAEAGGPCACGRGLPVIARILGRTRNMVRLPSGELRWAALESQRFAAIAPIAQYQLLQIADGSIRAHLVARRPLTAGEERELTQMLRWALGHDFAVAYDYVDAIPRGPGGKYEEFRSELSA